MANRDYVNPTRRDLNASARMMSKMKNPPTNYGAQMYGETTQRGEGAPFLGKIAKGIGNAVSSVASGVGNAVGGVVNAGKNLVGGVVRTAGGIAGSLLGGLAGGQQPQMPGAPPQPMPPAGGDVASAGGGGQQVTIEGTMSTGGGAANFKPHFKGGFGAGMYKEGAAFNKGFKSLPPRVQAKILEARKEKGSSMYKPGPGASMYMKKGGRV